MQPLSKADFSDAFMELAAAHDFRSLADMLNWPTGVLLMHNGFTYHHYQELRGFLKKNELLHLLRTQV